MTDVLTSEQRSRLMSRIKRRDSRAELAVRRALFRLGARYRIDDGGVFGHPDVSFRSRRVAVFIDSAFWHGHIADERIDQMPDYWRNKLRRNRMRDAEVNAQLSADGWTVVRVDEKAALRQTDVIARSIFALLKVEPVGASTVSTNTSH